MKKIMDYNIISNSPVFMGVKPENCEQLLSEIVHQFRTYNKGKTIALTGEKCNNLLIVISGSVRGEMTSASGRLIKIEDVPTSGTIAISFIFGKNNSFPVDVIANEDCKILFIPKESLLVLLKKNDLVLTNFLNIISQKSQFLSNKLKFLSFNSIKEKFANFLLNKAKDNLNCIYLTETQQQISDLFGVARPSLARTIKEMADEGLIEVKNKEIKILNKEALKRII